MEIIKTTPAALRAKANQIGESGANIRVTTNKMFDLVESLNGNVWTGDAQNAYTNQFDQLKDDASRMYQMTKELEADLNAIADQYEETENEIQNIAQSLATDVVY